MAFQPNTKSVSIMDDKKPWTPQSSSSSHQPDPDHDSTFPVFHARNTNAPKSSMRTRIIDSFKRDPTASVTRHTSISSSEDHRKPFDVESAAQATANTPLLRQLKGRHLQMIASM
jgi:hypothetical protein